LKSIALSFVVSPTSPPRPRSTLRGLLGAFLLSAALSCGGTDAPSTRGLGDGGVGEGGALDDDPDRDAARPSFCPEEEPREGTACTAAPGDDSPCTYPYDICYANGQEYAANVSYCCSVDRRFYQCGANVTPCDLLGDAGAQDAPQALPDGAPLDGAPRPGDGAADGGPDAGAGGDAGGPEGPDALPQADAPVAAEVDAP
jgi:hypothetical protein